MSWWAPDPRVVLFPNAFHQSRSFSRFVRRCSFPPSLNAVQRETGLVAKSESLIVICISSVTPLHRGVGHKVLVYCLYGVSA
ncbi:hypothetical protein [Sodalis sp.]|uniref:hypothetical protein n=1 Tax=Sodalis sp. (in: enterobacteria) TaxID=1898979 RepID=UPI003872E55D